MPELFQNQGTDYDQAMAILQQMQPTGAFVGGGMMPNQPGLLEMGISALSELLTGSSSPGFLAMGPQNVPPAQRLYQRDVMAPIWQKEQERILKSMGQNLGQDFAGKLAVPLAKAGLIESPDQFIRAVGEAGGSKGGQIATAMLMQQIGQAFGGTELDLARQLEPMRFGGMTTGGRILNPYAEEDVFYAQQTMDIRRNMLQTAIRGKVGPNGEIIQTLDPNIGFTRGFSEGQIGDVASMLARRGVMVQDEQGRATRIGATVDPTQFTGPNAYADWRKSQEQLEQSGVQRVGQTLGVLKSVGDFLGMTAEQMPEIIKSLDALQTNWHRMPDLQAVEKTFREISGVADVVSRATGTSKQAFAMGMLRAGKVMSEAEGLGEEMQRYGFGAGAGGELMYKAQVMTRAGAMAGKGGTAAQYGREVTLEQAQNIQNMLGVIGARSMVGVDLRHMQWLRQKGRISEETFSRVQAAAISGSSEARQQAFDAAYREGYGDTARGRALAQNEWVQRAVNEETKTWYAAEGQQVISQAQQASFRSMTLNELQRQTMAEQRLGAIGGPTNVLTGQGIREGMRRFFGARTDDRELQDVRRFLEAEHTRAMRQGMSDTEAWQVAMTRAEDDPRMRAHIGQLRRDVAGATTEGMTRRFAESRGQFRMAGALRYLETLSGTREKDAAFQSGLERMRDLESQAIAADQEGNTAAAARIRGQLAGEYERFVGRLDAPTQKAVRAVERDMDRQHTEQTRDNEAITNATKLARQFEEQAGPTKRTDPVKMARARVTLATELGKVDVRTADAETIARITKLTEDESMLGTERETLLKAIESRDQEALTKQLRRMGATTQEWAIAQIKAAGEGANLSPEMVAAATGQPIQEKASEIKAQGEQAAKDAASVPQTATNLAQAIAQALPSMNVTGVLTLVDRFGNVLATGSLTGDVGGGGGAGRPSEGGGGSESSDRSEMGAPQHLRR